MSASPPKEQDVEQNAQSGEDENPMDREQEGAQGQGLGDFEVKEQDRWLPIANGWFCPSPSHTSPFPCLDLSAPLRDTAACVRVSCLRQSDECATMPNWY